MSSYLCEELVIEIFKRLPPKSLLQFKSLSKSWRARISSADFIREQCLLSKKSPRKVVVRHRQFYQLEDYREFYGLYPEEKHYSKALVDQFPSSKFYIVGSCNGIICLLERARNIYIWNPSIGRKLTLNPPTRKVEQILGDFCPSENHKVALGFGFDPITNDYKAVKISYSYGNAKGLFVRYTIKKRASSKIAFTGISFSEVKSRACCFNGALHWVVKCSLPGITSCYIMTFNLSTDVIDKISLPKPDLVINQLTIIKGFLGVISRECDNHWIWVLREYNNVASWLRAYKLTSFGYGLDSDLQVSNYLEDYQYYDNETGLRSTIIAHTNSCYRLDLDMCVESLEWFDTETEDQENQPSAHGGKPEELRLIKRQKTNHLLMEVNQMS